MHPTISTKSLESTKQGSDRLCIPTGTWCGPQNACSTSMFSSNLHVKFVMDFVEELQLGLKTYRILTVKEQLN